MASYNADITVSVKVLDQQLRKLEQRIKQLDKIANPPKPLTRTQAAEELGQLKKVSDQLNTQKQQLEQKPSEK